MKFHIGDVAQGQSEPVVTEGWQRIHSPASRSGYLLAIVTGVLFFTVLCGGVSQVPPAGQICFMGGKAYWR